MISISGARSSSLPEHGQSPLTASRKSSGGSPSFQHSLIRIGSPWLVAVLASAALSCSEDGADAAGVGGTTANAGSSPGGQTSSAGTAGAAAGGTTATGGTGGGATGVTPLGSFDFAASIEGWVFVYAEPPTLIDTTPAPTGDAGVDAGPPPPPPTGVAVATHDPAVGDPLGNAGSALLQLPFSGPNQKIEIEGNVATGAAGDTGINLERRSITARIKVDSGLTIDPNNPAGVKIYVKTGPTSLYADSGYLNLNPTTDWQTVIWANVSTVGYVDPAGTHAPTDVRQIGIEFATGAAGAYSAATIHLDSVTY